MSAANTSFQILKIEDRKLLSSLKQIIEECNSEGATYHLLMAKGHKMIEVKAGQLDDNETLKAIFELNSTLLHKVTVNLKPPFTQGSINITRDESFDNVNIQFPQDLSEDIAVKLIASAHKHLKPFAPTHKLDRILGEELAEYYRKREETLTRLEVLERSVLEQNIEYRRRIDEEKAIFEENLTKECNDKQGVLEERFQEKVKELEEREQALDKLKQQFDDRSSKHARRQIRKDMLDKLTKLSEEFVLTKGTQKKRLPIHLLYFALILATGTFFTTNIIVILKEPNLVGDWRLLIRLTLSSILFVGSIIYYIRWNDRWFQRHSDEEFRLKQFALDIDRTNLVTEMALEFKDEEGINLPSELIEHFTQGLFIQGRRTKPLKHPTEDLASALLKASAGLKLNIPGFGEVTLDHKGVKTFSKALKDEDEDESTV